MNSETDNGYCFSTDDLLPNYRMADKCCNNCKHFTYLCDECGHCEVLEKESGIYVFPEVSEYCLCDLWEGKQE